MKAKAVRHSFSDGGQPKACITYTLIESLMDSNQKYVGHTSNIEERLNTHNSGGSIYTKSYRPWKLKVLLGFQTQSEARAFEKYLKTGSGRAFAQKRFW